MSLNDSAECSKSIFDFVSNNILFMPAFCAKHACVIFTIYSNSTRSINTLPNGKYFTRKCVDFTIYTAHFAFHSFICWNSLTEVLGCSCSEGIWVFIVSTRLTNRVNKIRASLI